MIGQLEMDGNTEIDCKFTINELAGLRQIIHVAVQARGMELAEAGVVLTRRINAFVDAVRVVQRPLDEMQTPAHTNGG